MSFNGTVLTVTDINSSTVQLSRLGDLNVSFSSIVVYYDFTAVTGVTLSQTEASMIVGGETLTLTPTFTPSDASIKTVTWTTSDASVATVTNGVVTAKGAGTATITATATNGTDDTSDDKTATCTVTVSYVNVSGVTLSQTAASMTVGNALTLTATVAPSNASNKTVTWTSSNTAVATVANGVVTAVAAGTTTITATATNGTPDDTSDDFSATCTVTVTDPATKYNLTLADGSDAHGTVAFTVDGAAATQAKKDDVVTVSVTPNEGYSAKDVTVRAYTSWEAAPARGMNRAPGLLDEIAVTKNETDGTWTFTMPEANVWVVATYTKNVQDAWIEAIADQTYTGSDIEPTVTVKDGETPLTLGADYTVAYSNNVETGTATVTVTGTGDYSGEATATFTIVADKSDLNDAISEAETYYNSIKDSNPAAAADLLTAINAAKTVQSKADATQAEVDNALTAISGAKTTAEQAVLIENSRVTITIPAKSYVARIDAEKRQIETAVSGVSLHTVTGVANSTVTLSDALTVVAAETPYLIYNDNDEEKTVSILMSTEEATAVTVASEFKGTLEAKTFSTADMQAADHYVLTGKNFVWVKDAGTLAAGKCWIQLTKSAGARRLGIVIGGDATGIAGVSGRTADHSGWYDLNGRRLAGKPGVKGLYVVDGKKVVVK